MLACIVSLVIIPLCSWLGAKAHKRGTILHNVLEYKVGHNTIICRCLLVFFYKVVYVVLTRCGIVHLVVSLRSLLLASYMQTHLPVIMYCLRAFYMKSTLFTNKILCCCHCVTCQGTNLCAKFVICIFYGF